MTYIDLGYQVNPKTGLRRRQKKWITVRGSREDAVKRRDELRHVNNRGEFVVPSKLTVGEWLDRLNEAVKRSKRPSTYTMYELVMRQHLKPALGTIALQALRPGHIQQYHATRSATHSGATLQLHHAVLSGALKSAVRQGMLTRNVATLVDGRPQAKSSREMAKTQAWTTDESRAFLAAAKEAGPQWAALFALAIDSGMRKGELCGLKWADVDLDAGKVTVDRQLLKPSS